MGSMEDLGSEVPDGATGLLCGGAGRWSSPTGLLEVKQQQVCCPTTLFQRHTGLASPHCHPLSNLYLVGTWLTLLPASVAPEIDRWALVVVQDAGWDFKVDGQVKELYLSVLRRLDTGAAAQTEWLSSAKSTLSGSMQQLCSTCKASSEKVCCAKPLLTGLPSLFLYGLFWLVIAAEH